MTARRNPTKITFRMPVQRTDGTEIDTQVHANLYVDREALISIPGDLNPGGTYTVEFAVLGWDPTPGTLHELTLTALEGPLESEHSEPVTVQFVGKPLPPDSFDAS